MLTAEDQLQRSASGVTSNLVLQSDLSAWNEYIGGLRRRLSGFVGQQSERDLSGRRLETYHAHLQASGLPDRSSGGERIVSPTRWPSASAKQHAESRPADHHQVSAWLCTEGCERCAVLSGRTECGLCT